MQGYRYEFFYKNFILQRGTTEKYRNWPNFVFLKRSDRKLTVRREYLVGGFSVYKP